MIRLNLTVTMNTGVTEVNNQVCLVLLFTVLVLSLSSCLDLQADLTLNGNGSGTLDLNYRVPQSLKDIQLLDGFQERFIPLPENSDEWVEKGNLSPGLTVSVNNFSSDHNYVSASVQIQFSTITDLNYIFSEPVQAAFVSGDDETLFQALLYEPRENVPDEENILLLKKVFPYDELNFTIRVPGVIKRFRPDKARISEQVYTYTVKAVDVIEANDVLSLEVVW